MRRNTFRALPSLVEAVHAGDEAGRGTMVKVVDSKGGRVRVMPTYPGAGEDPRWYPSSARNPPVGTIGVLIPLRGGQSLFIPAGGDMATTEWTHGSWWATNRYWGPPNETGMMDAVATNPAITANQTIAVPFTALGEVTVDQIVFSVAVAVASSEAKVGIFEAAEAGWAAPTPIVESAAVSTETTGTKSVTIPDTVLKAGHRYWVAVVGSHAISYHGYRPSRASVTHSGYSHTNYSSMGRDGASFALSQPTQMYVADCPHMQLRRKA